MLVGFLFDQLFHNCRHGAWLYGPLWLTKRGGSAYSSTLRCAVTRKMTEPKRMMDGSGRRSTIATGKLPTKKVCHCTINAFVWFTHMEKNSKMNGTDLSEASFSVSAQIRSPLFGHRNGTEVAYLWPTPIADMRRPGVLGKGIWGVVRNFGKSVVGEWLIPVQ